MKVTLSATAGDDEPGDDCGATFELHTVGGAPDRGAMIDAPHGDDAR